jgi:hypothetical protein
MQGQRVTTGALLALGRQDVEFAEVFERGGQRPESGRVNAIVIRDEQDGHRCLDATLPAARGKDYTACAGRRYA